MTELFELVGLACLPLFLAVDLFRGRRQYTRPRWWRTRGLAVTLVCVGLSMGYAAFWGAVVGDRTLLDLSGLGVVPGAMVGVLVYELVHYWYHRAAHRYDWLWYLGHQMHHSAEAIDAFSAYYLHPVDLFFFTTWSALVFFPLLGLEPAAGALGAAFLAFCAMFQHANIATPHWLGYLVQRPESHCVHHERGRHRSNYADLPLWDMVFGTFRNPRSVTGFRAGFYTGASTRIGDMLIGRDVARPRHPDDAEEPLARIP